MARLSSRGLSAESLGPKTRVKSGFAQLARRKVSTLSSCGIFRVAVLLVLRIGLPTWLVQEAQGHQNHDMQSVWALILGVFLFEFFPRVIGELWNPGSIRAAQIQSGASTAGGAEPEV